MTSKDLAAYVLAFIIVTTITISAGMVSHNFWFSLLAFGITILVMERWQ